MLDDAQRAIVAKAPILLVGAVAGSAAVYCFPADEAWQFTIFAGGLSALAVIDVASQRLPDRLTLPLLLFSVVATPVGVDERLLGSVFASLFLFSVGETFKRVRGVDGLGFGDVKLIASCGAWVGIQGVGPIILVAASTALAASFIPWTKSASDRKEVMALTWKPKSIAFGPYLAGATLLVTLLQAQGVLP